MLEKLYAFEGKESEVSFSQNYSMSLGKRQLVDSIWKSAGIEGLGTTFPNTEKILENLQVTTRQEEVFFIVNMKRAWYFLFDTVNYDVDLAYLRELNKITMQNLLYDAGSVRRGPVSIGGTSWRPDIPDEEEICSFLKSNLKITDKLEAALDMFCYLSRAQIFTDGNKRLATLVCNKILMQNDVGILSVPYDMIDRFKELLVSFYETNDSTEIKKFFIDWCILWNPDYDYKTQ